MPSKHLADILKKNETEILSGWIRNLGSSGAMGSGGGSEAAMQERSRRFLDAFSKASVQGSDTGRAEWAEVKDLLSTLSRSNAEHGLTPTQTATYVFALKQPIFEQISRHLAKSPEAATEEIWQASMLLDQLGLYTTEIYQQARNDIIVRQQKELLELSTPVVRLWQNILAVPLVGTLDSNRSQVVMEALLQKIVDTGAEIAIIDITGVPTVDTLVAQHLMKTVAATRLMGADCIISGIRPQIAQTIVHLGVNLGEIVTKATLADAFAVALKRTGATLAAPAAD